jgi:hypothetical protein
MRPRLHRGGAAALAAVLLCLVFLGCTGYTLRQLPEPGRELVARSIVVYDRNGQVLADRNPKGEYHALAALQPAPMLVGQQAVASPV